VSSGVLSLLPAPRRAPRERPRTEGTRNATPGYLPLSTSPRSARYTIANKDVPKQLRGRLSSRGGGQAAPAGPSRAQPRRCRSLAARAHAARDGRGGVRAGLRQYAGGRGPAPRRRLARDVLRAVRQQGGVLSGGL